MCEQGVAPYVAQSAPKVNFNVGEKMMNPTNIAIRLVQAIVLILMLAPFSGCTSLGPPVEMTQADIDYFRTEALRMVTSGVCIDRDNGKTLILISAEKYDARKPITYRILFSRPPHITVIIPIVTTSGGKEQELEFDVVTRQLFEARTRGWEY